MFDLNDTIALLQAVILWVKKKSFVIREVSQGEKLQGIDKWRGGGKIQCRECEREEAEEMDRVGLLCQRQSSCSHLAIISRTLTLP